MTPARISNSRAEAPGGGGEGGCGAVTGAVAGGGSRRVAGPRGAGWARPLLPPHSADHAALTRSGLPRAQIRGTSLARRWPPCARCLARTSTRTRSYPKPNPNRNPNSNPNPNPDPNPNPNPDQVNDMVSEAISNFKGEIYYDGFVKILLAN